MLLPQHIRQIVQTHLRGVALALRRIARNVAGGEGRRLERGKVDIRLVLPSVDNIFQVALAQGFLVDHSSACGIDNQCLILHASEQLGVAQMVGRVAQAWVRHGERRMKSDHIALGGQLVERRPATVHNAMNRVGVVDQDVHAFLVRHQFHLTPHIAVTDDADGMAEPVTLTHAVVVEVDTPVLAGLLDGLTNIIRHRLGVAARTVAHTNHVLAAVVHINMVATDGGGHHATHLRPVEQLTIYARAGTNKQDICLEVTQCLVGDFLRLQRIEAHLFPSGSLDGLCHEGDVAVVDDSCCHVAWV